MPIAINGSGTITGISVGGIPDGTVDTDVLAANAVTYAKIGTTEQGQLCKAWVNFNGTGTVAIRASYNVSSITDNGTGDYTVNFTTAMVDANYIVSLAPSSCDNNSVIVSALKAAANWGTPTTYTSSAVRIISTGNGGSGDMSIFGVAIFR
jgi:hypothetical protein